MIKELNPWLTNWRRPLVRALYLRDEESWRSLMAEAWEALANSPQADGHSEDAVQAIRCEFAYLQQQGERVFSSDPAEQLQLFEKARVMLEEPAIGPMSRVAQNYFLLLLLCTGQRLGYLELEESRFRAMFEAIPADEQDNQLWHHVSGWAFKQRNLEFLGQAFEIQLTKPAAFAGDFDWQRTNLMYRITAGSAEEQDVTEYISRLFTLPHASEFRQVIWPRLEEAGLGRPEFWNAFIEREAQIEADPQLPGRSSATRSARSQHSRP